MKLYTVEDFKGFEVQDHWTSFDVLAAVVSEVRKKELLDNNVEGSGDTNTMIKNKKLQKKKELVQVKENTIKKRKSDHCSEGCSNEQQSGKKKRRASHVPQIPSPELPEIFKNAIKELNGGADFTGEVKLLAEKTLVKTDLTAHHNRLLLPLGQMKRNDFLKENETEYLLKRINKHKVNFMEVKIIEPSLVRGLVNLCIWETGSLNHVLNHTWKDIVKRNGLEEDEIVQLWAFRIGEELCFALRKLP